MLLSVWLCCWECVWLKLSPATGLHPPPWQPPRARTGIWQHPLPWSPCHSLTLHLLLHHSLPLGQRGENATQAAGLHPMKDSYGYRKGRTGKSVPGEILKEWLFVTFLACPWDWIAAVRSCRKPSCQGYFLSHSSYSPCHRGGLPQRSCF